MRFVSDTVKSIERSQIRQMLKKQGEYTNVIAFSIGEPDFATPPNIVDAAIRALREGKTKYAHNTGIIELREAISRKLLRTHGVKYDPQTEIVVTACGMHTLQLTSMAVLNSGDEIVVPNPIWTNHPNHPKLVGAKPVFVSVYEKDGFMYDVDELETYITPKTKAILLNSPSNPTGSVIEYDQLVALCAFAKKYDLLIISDEVYQNIIYEDTKFYSPAMMDGMKERVVICDSFSKTYSMTGWRLGYAAGPAEIIDGIVQINENSVASVNTFVQYAGVEALNGTQEYAQNMVKEFQRRRDIVYEGINAIDGLSCIKPKGAFYAFVNIQSTGMTSEQFSYDLLDQKHVAVVPGSGFGTAGEGFIRLSYATSEEEIREGLRRIQDFMQERNK